MLLAPAIRRALIKLFDLREEEFAKTLRLQLTIFILLTVLLIVKPTITSLFLKELSSDALPLGYMLTAIFAVVGSVLYNKSLQKYELNGVIEKTLFISIFSLILFGVLLKLNITQGLFYYAMYIWVAIFGLLTASQFWILANLAYNVRQAKRVFGFIGAGAIAGAIFGGYLTSLLANFVDTENFLFLAAAFLVVCIPLTRTTWSREIRPLNVYQRSARKTKTPESSYQLIRKSPLLTQIAIVVGIGVIVAKLVDYQYSDYASRLIPDQDELTSFFGFWLSSLSMVSLMIQLFLTKRIVGTFGVGASLLWLPAGVLLGSLLLLLIPELWVVVFIKIVDGSLKQSVNKSAMELLSIPVPLEVKKTTKTFIDVVVDSIATGIAGLILIFFINGLNLPVQAVSFIIIGFIGIWLFFIYRVRERYIDAFKKVIERHDPKKTTKTEKITAPANSIVDSVNRVFSIGTENQILFMLKRTLETPDERFFEALTKLLNHPSENIRHLALENLYYLKSDVLTSRVQRMLEDSSQMVTTSAFKYLIKHHLQDTLSVIEKYLNHDSQSIRNAALIGLAQELRNNPLLKESLKLEQRIGQLRAELRGLQDERAAQESTKAILQAVGSGKEKSHYDFLSKHLNSQDVEIAGTAIMSCALTLEPQFILPISQALSHKNLRKTALAALTSYGEPIIPALVALVKEEKITLEQARYVPSLVEKFMSMPAVTGLLALASHTEHAVKMEAISSLKRIKQQKPKLKINERLLVDSILDECSMYENTLAALHTQILAQYITKTEHDPREKEARNTLIHLLESRLERQLERIFNFLGLKYPPEDVAPVYDTIKMGKQEERLHALEFLDNILDPQLKRELLPIVESATLDPTSEDKIKQLNITTLNDIQCFSLLLQRPDLKLKLAVLQLIKHSRDKKYLPLLEPFLHNSHEKLHRSAKNAWNSIHGVSSL